MLTAEEQELLSYAATAAGIEVVTPTMLKHGKWNPLMDDGDALRLAVNLGLSIHISHQRIKIYHNGIRLWSIILGPEVPCEKFVRRAIVCAAAEIGKAMD